MSLENIEVVRRLFETYSRGDYDDAATCLAPGVVYEVCVRKLEFKQRSEALEAAGLEP